MGPQLLSERRRSGLPEIEADRIVAAVKEADQALTPGRRPASARPAAPELLHDGRLPIVKHDELVAVQFLEGGKNAGIVVQWNCHPETLDSKNTQLSADFVRATVEVSQGEISLPRRLPDRHRRRPDDFACMCRSRTTRATMLKDGTFEKTERYGRLVGQLAEKALERRPGRAAVPPGGRTRNVFLPLDNPLYQLGWRLGVLDRQAFSWTGDPPRPSRSTDKAAARASCAMRTEVGYFRLGDLDVAAIPGEIYPELVLGKVQDPADPAADFPDAPIEPSIYGQLKGQHRMIIGLANDEIGYIIPKRQWDEKAPFCYGRKTRAVWRGQQPGAGDGAAVV